MKCRSVTQICKDSAGTVLLAHQVSLNHKAFSSLIGWILGTSTKCPLTKRLLLQNIPHTKGPLLQNVPRNKMSPATPFDLCTYKNYIFFFSGNKCKWMAKPVYPPIPPLFKMISPQNVPLIHFFYKLKFLSVISYMEHVEWKVGNYSTKIHE